MSYLRWGSRTVARRSQTRATSPLALVTRELEGSWRAPAVGRAGSQGPVVVRAVGLTVARAVDPEVGPEIGLTDGHIGHKG